MKVTYDPEVDALRIVFSAAPVEESDEDRPGVMIDYDQGRGSQGKVRGWWQDLALRSISSPLRFWISPLRGRAIWLRSPRFHLPAAIRP